MAYGRGSNLEPIAPSAMSKNTSYEVATVDKEAVLVEPIASIDEKVWSEVSRALVCIDTAVGSIGSRFNPGLGGIKRHMVESLVCRTNILKRPDALGPDLSEDEIFEFEEKTQLIGGVLIQKEDVVDAILFLASYSARTITRTNLLLDRGRLLAGPLYKGE
ncbi:uncharacterized protein LOC143462094 [Clavelina lepadiformis]|uniref:uncharacterized protein LOC143462094 n=1 Tax=Clavelina lepadiformis TaxID=159417 RepID=UPI0040416EAE